MIMEVPSEVLQKSNTLDHNTTPAETLEVKVACSTCWNETEPVYRQGWLCRDHAPTRRLCQYKAQGCTYTDVNDKCVKHEWCYCQYSTRCEICSTKITDKTRHSHHTKAHGDITFRAGTECSVSAGEYFFIDCAFGRAVCDYSPFGHTVTLYVRTPLPSEQLYKYRCAVEISHPGTGHTHTCIATLRYDRDWDWEVRIPYDDFEAHVHNKKIHTKINITKLENPLEFLF